MNGQTVTSESPLPHSRSFVRNLNALLKFVRLYGIEHVRSATQLDATWNELRRSLEQESAPDLLLGASGSQLLVGGAPVEATPAERSFVEILNAAGIASISFARGLVRQDLTNLVRAFAEAGPKAGSLIERLETFQQATGTSAIRLNEVRFVAEDPTTEESRVAVQLAAEALGGDAELLSDWFRSPEKLIQLMTAAEAAHQLGGTGEAGAGVTGPAPGLQGGPNLLGGLPSPAGSASPVDVTPGATAAGRGPGPGFGTRPQADLTEEDMRNLLRLIAQFGSAGRGPGARLDARAWQERVTALPPAARLNFRQALASVVAASPGKRLDAAMLLRLAEDLAIRFALERFERGDVKVNAVRQMLGKMNAELEKLRKLLRAREEKMAAAGMPLESHEDVLDRQFWASVSEAGKRGVLLSPDSWCVPPRNIQQYLEEALQRGRLQTAEEILLRYAACVRYSEAEARRKTLAGLSEMAGLYARAGEKVLQGVLASIGQQLKVETESDLQTLLRAAFARFVREASSQRAFAALAVALDAVNELEEKRLSCGEGLRPLLGIENRIPELLEVAVNTPGIPKGLVDVLRRVPDAASEQLALRLGRTQRRGERDRVVEISMAMGAPCVDALRTILRGEPSVRAASAAGLLSRLDALAVEELLRARLRETRRTFHDAVVRQLSVAGAPNRGRILAGLLEELDPVVVPLALDEIGMSGDAGAAAKLIRMAEGELIRWEDDYLRVKAVEALGRMRAAAATEPLQRLLVAKRTFGWEQADEIRLAAAQALAKIDPEWLRQYLPKSGIEPELLEFAPLDPKPERDFVRYRRYPRVRLPHAVSTVVNSIQGKYAVAMDVLSMDGGLLSGDLQLPVGSEATLKIPAGLRSISLQAVVRFVRSHQAGFEVIGMDLEDRARLRRMLLSYARAKSGAQLSLRQPA